MKVALIVLSLLLVTGFTVLFALAVTSKTGAAPGLVEGRLARCPDTPNCVCSEYPEDDAHYVKPLAMAGDTPSGLMPRLEKLIRETGGAVQHTGDAYLAATFSSRLLGFVDDVELRPDPGQGVIHVRSAARVGYGDMGVNRRRVERLRENWGQS